MSATDVTRLLKGQRQHYVGGRVLQGRPLLECDDNEDRRARADDFTAAIREVAGLRGSPDDGFLPDLVPGQVVASKLVRFGALVQAYVLDYPLKPGSMQLAGWRFEQEAPASVVFQREFLQMGPAAAPLAQIGTQRQFSILRAWEQPVSAIEDSELFEPALHGADGALRSRRMRRVETRTVDAEDCALAFDEVLETLGHKDTVSYVPETGLLQSNARLQLTFGSEPPGDCPGCDPLLRGQYLGSADQAIRIMLASSGSYVWATDDSAPLYRAKLIFDGSGARVEMLSPPKDSFHEPKADRVVEFLPWSALLENGTPSGGKGFDQPLSNEKVAERVGVLGTVDTPYDPDDRSFHARLDTEALQAFGLATPKTLAKSPEAAAQKAVKTGNPPGQEVIALEWDPAHPNAAELNPGSDADGAEIGYVYLRFWHVKRPGQGVAIPLGAGLPLGATGVVPVFSGKGRRGDFWRASLRVAKRDTILPWAIMESGGLPPDGPIEAVMPLALVVWRSLFGQSHEVLSIEDCRPNLPAITNRGCCTHVVGHGAGARYASVQAAIDALPVSGGRICIREGDFSGDFHLSGRENVLIEGCGDRTVLLSGEDGGEALATLASDSGGRVTMRNLSLRAAGQIAVALQGESIALQDLRILSAPSEAAPAGNAICGIDVSKCDIRGCRITMAPGTSAHSAICLRAVGEVLVEGNQIAHEGEGRERAWGGIHLMGESHGAELRGNRIERALGHGVTLGSVEWRAPDGTDLGLAATGFGQILNDGTLFPTARLGPVTVDGQTYYPESDPAITDLMIADNEIEGCSGSGIGALALEVIHDEIASAAPLCMRRSTFPVSGTLRGNRLSGNAAGAGAPEADRVRGGITLSDVQSVTIEKNTISGFSRTPGSGPRDGIFVAFGAGLFLRRNKITLHPSTTDAAPDLSGGIILGPVVTASVVELMSVEAPIAEVRIEGNTVSCGNGPALVLHAGGACAVSGNALETAARTWGSGPIGATTVAILHPTRVAEAVDLPTGEPSPDRWLQPIGSQEFLSGRAQNIEATGGLVVCDNQISTRLRVKQVAGALIPVSIFSLGSVTFTDNQLSARMASGTMAAQAFVVGATVACTDNRVAETLEVGNVSLIAVAPFLALGTGNHLTHCPAIFGCQNHENDPFFAADDNLTWFRAQDERCESTAAEMHPDLSGICTALFGESTPEIPVNRGRHLSDLIRRRGP